MGEIIALTSIKTVIVRGGKDLHNLYKGLLRDINRADDDMSRYSDGYEIAQEAMLFLCRHMGKRLDNVHVTKTGRKTTIKQACFSLAGRYLAKNFVAPMLNTTSLNKQIATQPETILDDEQKNDYTAVDKILSEMKLTSVEQEILIEKAKAENFITKDEICDFIFKAIKKNPDAMIRTLIKQIVVYDDKIEIFYNFTSKNPDDDGRDFSLLKGSDSYPMVGDKRLELPTSSM